MTDPVFSSDEIEVQQPSARMYRFVIKSSAVSADKIGADAVTEPKIAADAVTEQKIASDAVKVGTNVYEKTGGIVAVLDSLYTDGFYFQENLPAASYSVNEIANGTVTNETLYVDVGVTAASGDAAQLFRSTRANVCLAPLTWDKDREFRTKVEIRFDGGDFSNTTARMGIGSMAGGAKGVGFRLVNNTALTAFCQSDASNVTAESTGVTVANGTAYLLEVDFVAGSHADFYVDGAKVATIYTNLPSGDETSAVTILYSLYLENTGAASGIRSLFASWAKFAQHT